MIRRCDRLLRIEKMRGENRPPLEE